MRPIALHNSQFCDSVYWRIHKEEKHGLRMWVVSALHASAPLALQFQFLFR